MTYFLPEADQNRRINPLPNDLPTYFEGLAASTRSAMIEGDANFKAWNTRRSVTMELAEPAARQIGIDKLNERYERDGAGYDHLRPAPQTVDEFFAMHGDEASRIALDLAREDATQNPDAWTGKDLSDAAIEQQTNERLQAEYEDAQKIIGMMPDGAGSAQIVGGLIGSVADVRNLPWLLAGGGEGSFLRIMGREAFLNMGAEATQLPSRFKMAERLDIPAPSIVETMAEAAAGGAAFGAVFEGLARGIRYYRGRNTAKLPGYDAKTSEDIVNMVEAAIQRSENPVAAAQKAAREATPENPLSPGREPLILQPDQRVREPRTPDAEEQAILDGLQADVQAKLTEAGDRTQPLLTYLRRSGIGDGGEGKTLQIHPDGPVAEILRSQDITSRTNPGLYSRRGVSDLDNLPRAEWEDRFPGITEATGTAPDATYLDRQGVIDLLIRSSGGDNTWLRPKADLKAAQDALSGAETALQRGERLTGPQKDYLDQKAAAGGLQINLDEVQFTHGGDFEREIERQFDQWLGERWPGLDLTPGERTEILSELNARGGDAEYLVERALERDLNYAEAAPSEVMDVPFGDVPAASRENPGGPLSDPGADRSSGAGQAGHPVTEATGAGEQFLAPGIAPVSERQRLESRQNAPLRGGDRPVTDGLFDVAGRDQMEMFSEPSSNEARVIQDDIAADLRDGLTPKEGEAARIDDFSVDVELPDGTVRKMKATEVLDWLDEGDKASARMDLCGGGNQ